MSIAVRRLGWLAVRLPALLLLTVLVVTLFLSVTFGRPYGLRLIEAAGGVTVAFLLLLLLDARRPASLFERIREEAEPVILALRVVLTLPPEVIIDDRARIALARRLGPTEIDETRERVVVTVETTTVGAHRTAADVFGVLEDILGVAATSRPFTFAVTEI